MSDVKSCIGAVIKLAENIDSDDNFDKVTQAFRSLRNVCTQGFHYQNEIASNFDLLQSTGQIMQFLIDSKCHSDNAHLCLRVGLQFVANLLVNNTENQAIVWKQYQKILLSCLKYNDLKIQNCVSMILYNICLGETTYLFELENFFESIINIASKENSDEFSLFLLHLFILKTTYLQNCYDFLKVDSRLFLIEVMEDLIKSDKDTLNSELISFFVNKFLNHSKNIIEILLTLETSMEAYEVIKILELLISFSSSSNKNYLEYLQTKKSFLVNCVMLLKKVHIVSKETNNTLSTIQKLSELNEMERNLPVQKHIGYGFKSSLIRIIGNLCWKNKENQNVIRDMECIPVILDSCSIDGRNPFITQWAILAIRNICDKNAENQKFIAEMPKSGAIDIDKLKNMGIVLNEDNKGSTITISPLKLTE